MRIRTLRFIFKILPWFLLLTMIVTLYLSNYSPFRKNQSIEMIDSSVILKEIEKLGSLELVKYNFREIYDYRQISEGKIAGNSVLRISDYTPDLNVILVAAGEAAGCIDLTKMSISDVSMSRDSVLIVLPSPELCYYKLDMDNTRIYSFKTKSWWSRLFSDSSDDEQVLQNAYRQTEKRIEEAAYESGILQATNEQALNMLKPMLEHLSGRKVRLVTSLPAAAIAHPD
jgi:hypothetical protein